MTNETTDSSPVDTAPARPAVAVGVPNPHLQRLIATTQDGVVFINSHSKISLANRAAERIFGFDEGELLGQPVTVLMPQSRAEQHDRYIEAYEATGEANAIGKIRSVEGMRRNGDVFPLELSVTELGPEQNFRYAAFIRDISATANLQSRLLERERLAAIGRTAATFAHEVGNPLNGIYMTMQLLERSLVEQKNPDATVLSRVDNIRRQLERMRALLDDFRSLSRKQKYTFEPTELVELAQEVLTTQAEAMRRQNVEATVTCDAPEVWLIADSAKLVQVVLNLCKNAMEAMSNEGTIHINIIDHGDQVQLSVGDSGCGIPPSLDIFEPFTSTKTEGTGLGLPFVRQVIAVHHGRIRYASNDSGGTTFDVWLPRQGPTTDEAMF